jgi:hypothetical protein
MLFSRYREATMRGLKALLWTMILFPLLAPSPKVRAQVTINIGGPPPVCAYGYYSRPPYSCAPHGYYGSGYFYNGIFLGVGPWRHWGYSHGWGNQRYRSGGYGHSHRPPAPSYRPPARPGYRPPNNGGRPPSGGNGGRPPSGGGSGRPPSGGGSGRPPSGGGGGRPPKR